MILSGFFCVLKIYSMHTLIEFRLWNLKIGENSQAYLTLQMQDRFSAWCTEVMLSFTRENLVAS